MALDFQQVRRQVLELGASAPARELELAKRRELAAEWFTLWKVANTALLEKVRLVVAQYDPAIRCALPLPGHGNRLDLCIPTPDLPSTASLLAADGSQINLDRHSAVDYCLINTGAIQIGHNTGTQPEITVRSWLYYAEELYTATGLISEQSLALQRDVAERGLLAELATGLASPVVAITDGPIELWGAKHTDTEAETEFRENLNKHLHNLARLAELGVATAGYVDKPSADLVIRLLEIAEASGSELQDLRHYHPLRGVSDYDLFAALLAPGERSGVFGIQSQSARQYQDQLGLHFFYMNVGREGHPWIPRVEVPAWVAQNPLLLDTLHAVLVNQCQLVGERPYPYILHRAHEVAVVSQEERDQVTAMISLELRRRGLSSSEVSAKQALKLQPGRKRYTT